MDSDWLTAYSLRLTGWRHVESGTRDRQDAGIGFKVAGSKFKGGSEDGDCTRYCICGTERLRNGHEGGWKHQPSDIILQPSFEIDFLDYHRPYRPDNYGKGLLTEMVGRLCLLAMLTYGRLSSRSAN